MSGVIPIISKSAQNEARVLRIPKKSEIPIKNSMEDKTIPANKGKNEGTHEAIPKATR
ncbi:hypothetical protein EVA_15872 [gut metagenome]|uniref:Uncharacterized protein n=1 Tax=gut metagenome TaxID=749906 RepID=J9FM79_9ZZZZ